MSDSGDRFAFPPDFVWGAGTSAYQIEGAVTTDGRGRSIWDVFCDTPGRVAHGDSGEVACDHYNRIDTDLDVMAEIGLQAYRFSVAWPRIQPAGFGPVNQPGIDFYRRLVEGLLLRGIRPMVTLYHWDLPQSLQDRGGWVNRDTAVRFAEYAQIMAAALGDTVELWTTLNEPWVAAWIGYGAGLHAPGVADLRSAAIAHHHMLLGHGMAVQLLRAGLPDDRQIGIALNMAHVYPASDHPDDLDAANVVDGQFNRSFADPVLRGEYPTDIGPFSDTWADPAGPVSAGDLDLISTPIDFLGVNSYHPRTVAAASRVPEAERGHTLGSRDRAMAFGMDVTDVELQGVPLTAMGWPIQPQGLSDLLTRIHRDYRIPVFITENGAAFEDQPADGAVDDRARISYLDTHIGAVAAAIEAGVDVRGYFVWSLLDNFEWAFGYDKRFGIVHVDFETLKRTPKASAGWYRDLIAAPATTRAAGHSADVA